SGSAGSTTSGSSPSAVASWSARSCRDNDSPTSSPAAPAPASAAAARPCAAAAGSCASTPPAPPRGASSWAYLPLGRHTPPSTCRCVRASAATAASTSATSPSAWASACSATSASRSAVTASACRCCSAGPGSAGAGSVVSSRTEPQPVSSVAARVRSTSTRRMTPILSRGPARTHRRSGRGRDPPWTCTRGRSHVGWSDPQLHTGGTMANDLAARLREVLDPVVAASDLYLEGVEVTGPARRRLVRVTVDLPDGPGGVGSDRLGDVSHAVSEALDGVHDALEGSYLLEVTTPGVSRPLTEARHFRRAE